jgi:hypothetical protein
VEGTAKGDGAAGMRTGMSDYVSGLLLMLKQNAASTT